MSVGIYPKPIALMLILAEIWPNHAKECETDRLGSPQVKWITGIFNFKEDNVFLIENNW